MPHYPRPKDAIPAPRDTLPALQEIRRNCFVFERGRIWELHAEPVKTPFGNSRNRPHAGLVGCSPATDETEQTKPQNTRNMIHIPANPAAYIAANHIVGLSLDRLPSGQVLACEVREDEAGQLRAARKDGKGEV